MKKLNHLEEVYKDYDTYVIDLWGVIHNGVRLNIKAIEAVEKLVQNKKKVIFLSNAPRPSKEVKKFLQELNMKDQYLQNIVTSGEAAMLALQKESYGKFFYHLGPERDSAVFLKLKKTRQA